MRWKAQVDGPRQEPPRAPSFARLGPKIPIHPGLRSHPAAAGWGPVVFTFLILPAAALAGPSFAPRVGQVEDLP